MWQTVCRFAGEKRHDTNLTATRQYDDSLVTGFTGFIFIKQDMP